MNIPSLYFTPPIMDLRNNSESAMSFIARRKTSNSRKDKDKEKKYVTTPFKGKNKGDQLDYLA